MPDIFWGYPIRVSSTEETGTVGIVVNGVRVKNSTFAAGKRIADAGQDGIDTDAVLRTDVDILRSAGVNIATDPFGLRWRLDGPLPTPSRYLVKVDRQASPRTGQFGASLKQHAAGSQYGGGSPKAWGQYQA